MNPKEIAALTSLSWFRELDRVRQDVIIAVAMNMDRLSQPMVKALEHRDWIGAAYELRNFQQWTHEVGSERCKEWGNALEYGRWG